MTAVAVVIGVVGVLLAVLGLVGLLAPARYHSMMRSRRPIAGLRVISTIELVVGIAAVVVAAVLLSAALA